MAKDTETLKAAEQQRAEKLDAALADLETVITDLKSSNKRREDEAQRVRDDVANLKGSIPKALDAQKHLTDTRLQEVNAELRSLKTILSQRMQQPTATNPLASRSPAPSQIAAFAPSPASAASHENGTNGTTNGHATTEEKPKTSNGASFADVASNGRSSPFSSGISSATVKIPEWQRAMASKKSSSSITNTGADAGSSSQADASGSSS